LFVGDDRWAIYSLDRIIARGEMDVNYMRGGWGRGEISLVSVKGWGGVTGHLQDFYLLVGISWDEYFMCGYFMWVGVQPAPETKATAVEESGGISKNPCKSHYFLYSGDLSAVPA
jgi:hypothetical protein